MVKVVVNNGQYKITIPKDIAQSKNWSSQTRLMILMNSKEDLVLREV